MRIFIDCTDTYYSGLNTGIQRVVRNFVRHSTALGPVMGLECIPFVIQDGAILPISSLGDPPLQLSRHTLRGFLNSAYLSVSRHMAAILPFPPLQRFLLAHRSQFGLAWLLFSPLRLMAWLRSLGKLDQSPPNRIEDSVGKGDILFLSDASWTVDFFNILGRLKAKGARIVFFVHDVIPLTHPQVYHPTHVERFQGWFKRVIENADFLVFNSRFTQRSVTELPGRHHANDLPASAVVHLGYDLGPAPIDEIRHGKLRKAMANTSRAYLCVGTLEPRKNLDVLINAFERLWNDGQIISLLLIGRAGWLCDDLLVRIRRHPERGRRLFWFNDVSDTDLALAYRQASALIFPSIVEGFGLPLVEALSHGLPVIASDIPVFREIAGGHARYFPPHDAQALAEVVRHHAKSSPVDKTTLPFRWLTWEESTRELLAVFQILDENRSSSVSPSTGSVHRALP